MAYKLIVLFMGLNDKQMRVFISSTFKDLNTERDYLVKNVFPELKAIARSRGVQFVPLDLRWGVTSEDKHHCRVLEVCLREIDNSHPYFIGIIGNRYGWCPASADYNANDNLSKKFKRIRRYIDRNLSITEIEFLYAAIDNKKDVNAAFFIKSIDWDKEGVATENGDKLKKFRNKVGRNTRYPVKEFSTDEQLGQAVREYVLMELDKISPKNVVVDDFKKIKEIQDWHLKSLCEAYVPNVRCIKELKGVVAKKMEMGLSGSNSWLSLVGHHGSGRSSLLAFLINDREFTEKANVVYVFVGLVAEVMDAQSIAEYIINQIEELYGISEDDFICEGEEYEYILRIIEEVKFEFPQESLEVFYKIMMMGELLKDRKPLIVVLDDITYLSEKEWEILLAIACFTEKYFFYIMTENDGGGNLSKDVVKVRPLTVAQRRQITRTYLRGYAKELNADQLYRISHGTLTGNPGLLRILLDELVIYGSYEGLDSYIDYYLSALDERTFYKYLYDRYEADYGESLVKDVVSILKIVGPDCLSEDELVELVEVSNYEWSRFFCAARNQFNVINGLIRMTPIYNDDVVKERYLVDEKTEMQYRRRIADYLKNKDYLHVRRYCKILAAQLNVIADKNTFFQFLNQLPVYRMLSKVARHELGFYWLNVYWDDDVRLVDHSLHFLYMQMLEEDSSGDDFYDLASFIIKSDVEDKEVVLNCLYEAEKRYEGVPSKVNLRYKVLHEIAYYVSDDNEAIDVLKKALCDISDDCRRIECYSEMAFHYDRLSLFENAIELIEKALGLMTEENETHLGLKHSKKELMAKLSELYFATERYEDSMKYCECLYEILTTLVKERDFYRFDLIDLYIRMGANAYMLNMYAECRTFLEKAIALIETETEFDLTERKEQCLVMLKELK